MKINFTKLLAPAMILGALVFGTSAMAQGNGWHQGWNNNYHNNSYNQQYPSYQQKQSLNERIQNQKQRINDGIRDRSLTFNEANNLRSRLAQLERQVAFSNGKGYMTTVQFNQFQTQLDQISNVIYNAKHNAQNANYNNYRRF
jgi:hypothetical protein